MTKINLLMYFLFLLIPISFYVIAPCSAALSDKQLCHDLNCSEIISLAKTVLTYRSNDPDVLSFNINADVKVFSKEAGKRTDLWGVEINGERGFAPKKFLKEYKVLQRVLLHEVPVQKFNDESDKVHTKESESSDKIHEIYSHSKDKLVDNDGEALLSSVESVDIVQESEMIDGDSISPSYEVIDGTTLHFENEPSADLSFVTETVRVTALPNEKAPFITDVEKDRNNDADKIIFNGDKLEEVKPINVELEGIKLPIDIREKINSKEVLDSSETTINSTLDTNKNNTLLSDERSPSDSRSEDEQSKNLGHEGLIDGNSRENVKQQKEEEVTDTIETESIIASLRKKFTILSSTQETVTSTTSQDNNDILIHEAVPEVKITEESIPAIQNELESNLDSSQNEIKIQQNIHGEVSDEEVLVKEASVIILENATSFSDVPSSNNFVHEDVDNSDKNVPIESSILVNDSFISVETNIDSPIKDIQDIQDTNKEEKIIENMENEGIIVSYIEEATFSPHLQETAPTEHTTIQNNIDIQQTLLDTSKTYLENAKQEITGKEVSNEDNKVALTDKVLETDISPAIKKESENVTVDTLPENYTITENMIITDEALNDSVTVPQINEEVIVHNNINKNDNLVNHASSEYVSVTPSEFFNGLKNVIPNPKQSVKSSQEDEEKVSYDKEHIKEDNDLVQSESESISHDVKDHEDITNEDPAEAPVFLKLQEIKSESEEDNIIDIIKMNHNYWRTLIYLGVTAFTILLFTLGYYYIENIRRDRQFISRINELEKELLVSRKEFEGLSNMHERSKYEKLHHRENELLDSNEMVISLRAELEASQNTKTELEDQINMLEKELENATEAGLELERMLREVLSSNNAVNPVAKSVEDLQARLNAQQTANESLTNALNVKAQEIETLSVDVSTAKKKGEEFETELSRVQNDLANQKNLNDNMKQTLADKIHNLEIQINELSTEKSLLYKELKGKEIEMKELATVIDQVNSNNVDFEKLYDAIHLKTEAIQLREERDELKARLNDVEGAHQLLEEHMKLIKKEIAVLSDQYNIAEKEKSDAETRLEVLSKFFKEKEAERQKEETIWLQQQGEVTSTLETIRMMQNEIQNYKQQIEVLKREIVDQEREYKGQISALETKAHEQWVAARQNERRLEELKAEAGQLRNRLTLVEKSLNDNDSETKLHRLETNGETTASPALFIGTESSSSPVIFNTSSGVPPPPPAYLHCFPPYLPPLPPAASDLSPYDISQRPPPLGGRLSSPPPMPLHPSVSSRYENTGSPPPPISPHLLPPFNHHRSPPPPFGDHIPPPPPPPSGSILPPPFGTTHSWAEESLPRLRNSGFHPHQREQRTRNHKGSLHSSGESLDKTHHGKV